MYQKPVNKFCAVCTSETGPFDMEPLGRNGAMVLVCRSCRMETPGEREHLFGAGRSSGQFGVGEGNRRPTRGGKNSGAD